MRKVAALECAGSEAATATQDEDPWAKKGGVYFMLQLKRFSLVALVIAASGITATYAQTIFRARPVGHYSQGGMFKLSKISEPEAVAGCDRGVLFGTVESAAHNDKNEIVNFALKTQSGERRTINLSTSLYPQLPLEAEMGLAKLLTAGKRVRVVAYSCQGAACVLEADEIRAL